MIKKNIIWLASYPKSGNTWFRAFLTALQNGGEVDINELKISRIFSGKELAEWVCDTDSDEWTREETEARQRTAFRYLSDQSREKMFVKIHDAYTYNASGEPRIPGDATHCAIYFVRNPLDVAVSLANHNHKPVEWVVDQHLNNPASAFSVKPFFKQFYQPLLDWSGHAESWMRVSCFPVHVLRYEDMLADTFRVFKEVISKVGLTYTDSEIQAAINASSFDTLRRQEEEKGFKEKMPESPRFFNAGIAGGWKQVLSAELADVIKKSHQGMMRQLGY